MKRNQILAMLAMIALTVVGCGTSKRIVIEGYNDAALNGKRIFVLLPTAADIRFANAEQFASSRGVTATSAGETFENELRTDLITALQNRFDSNAVFSYAEQAVAGIVPLSASTDFTDVTPKEWTTISKAGREGNIDFLLVLRDLVVTNTAAADPRGDETMRATYSLLDIAGQKVMASGPVEVDVDAPRTPGMTHERAALLLSEKLPFVIIE